MSTEKMGVCPRTESICQARLICEGNRFLLDKHINEVLNRKKSVIGVVNSLISKAIGLQNPYDTHIEQDQSRRDQLDSILLINCLSEACVVDEMMERERVYGR